MRVIFETNRIAVVKRKLAAAKELFGDGSAELVLGVLPQRSPLVTTCGAEIWCSSTPEPVHWLGRKLAHLEGGGRLNLRAQESALRWHLEIREVQRMDPQGWAQARAGEALEAEAERLATREDSAR